jgi:hypothetical protein
MDEKEREEFFKAAAKHHCEVREQVMKNMRTPECIYELSQLKALRERQALESLGRWVISKCLINGIQK